MSRRTLELNIVLEPDMRGYTANAEILRCIEAVRFCLEHDTKGFEVQLYDSRKRHIGWATMTELKT
jgi:hypothetical protein